MINDHFKIPPNPIKNNNFQLKKLTLPCEDQGYIQCVGQTQGLRKHILRIRILS